MRAKSVCLAVVVVGALAALGAAVGYGQIISLVGPEKEALIYDGDLAMDSGGIEITPWGSGKAEAVYDEAYVGPRVLKIESQGPYQGVVLHLNRPADLSEFVASGCGYLDLRILPGQPKRERAQVREQSRLGAGAGGLGGRSTSRLGGGGGLGGGARGGGGLGGGARGGGMGGGARGGGMGGGGGMRGGGMGGGAMGGGMGGGGMRGGAMGGGGGMRGGMGGGARGGGMAGGGGMRGGMGGGGMRGGPGAGATRQPGAPGATTGRAPGAAAAAGPKELNLRSVRVVLFTDEGPVAAESPVVGTMPKDKRGWFPVTISLTQFRGIQNVKKVRAVGIFADEADVFYLGQVRLLVDRTPVSLELKAEPAIARVGKVIEFSAETRGGAIDPDITWDFNAADGLQEQAVGPKVKYVFKEPGDYMVTCTVKDKAGVRPAISKATGVHIEAASE